MTIEKDRTTSLTATLNNDDLEGDGLPDYYEEHGYIDGFGNRHTSDPDLTDTDGDGLDDKAERGWGTDPFNPDSGGDGLLNGVDPGPTKPEGKTVDPPLAEIGRAILPGAAFVLIPRFSLPPATRINSWDAHMTKKRFWKDYATPAPG
ncbi:hypothetical protein [uncultured Methanofollis sp.]|uniref:hypothetical protein n=1 Tax=uncultured Methanofollis sp. TaxID=262500 RepID=UPI00260360F7|nr:hypothetical protein [uncultured Methanofollis sp.]